MAEERCRCGHEKRLHEIPTSKFPCALCPCEGYESDDKAGKDAQ